MRLFPSFTSSSSWGAFRDDDGRICLRILCVALLLVAVAELSCRVALAPLDSLWEYWSPPAAQKFEWYRRHSQELAGSRSGHVDVLLCGDSTAARDLNPEVFRDVGSTGLVYNLGWPANFAGAFRHTTVPLLRDAARVPRVVVVSFAPGGFCRSPTVERFEASILSSPYCRRARAGWLLQDYVWLTRIRAALPYRSRWFREKTLEPPPDWGFMGLDGQDGGRNDLPNGGFGTAEKDRLSVLDELARMSKERGFQLVVLIPPQHGNRPGEVEGYMEALNRISKLPTCDVIDCRHPAGANLQTQDFWNANHLNSSGAEKFSTWLATELFQTREARSPGR